jgi:uncharacterized protein with HEPN domain
MNRDQVLVRHILGAVDRIEQYTNTLSKTDFFANYLVQDAVMRNLEIIGEACRSIRSEVKEKYPEIPWRSITAMRNKLIHEYFGVDIEAVWNVVQLDLPELKNHSLRILNSQTFD